jgi:hypothetical protein
MASQSQVQTYDAPVTTTGGKALVERVQILDASGAVAGVAVGTAGAPTTQTSVAATSTSAALLASNAAATYRQIVNAGTDSVTVKLGTGTVTDYAGIFMPANSSWDGWIGNRFYTGALAVKTLTTTATVSVVEA